MGIEHHLLRLARIGPHEEHPAVAQADMRYLDRGRDPIDQDDLVAPVELIGFARGKAQRHEGGRSAGALGARPDRGIAADRIIPALIPETAQFLIDLDQRQALPAPTSRVDRQQPAQLLKPGAQLRAWLNRSGVGELRYPGADHLAHHLLRQLQVTADRLDPLALGKMQPPNFCDCLHDQHPALGLR